MNRARFFAFLRIPGNWRIQAPINLKDAGTVAILLKFLTLRARDTTSADFKKLPWGYVTQNNGIARQIFERSDSGVCDNFAAEFSQVIGKSIRNCL